MCGERQGKGLPERRSGVGKGDERREPLDEVSKISLICSIETGEMIS